MKFSASSSAPVYRKMFLDDVLVFVFARVALEIVIKVGLAGFMLCCKAGLRLFAFGALVSDGCFSRFCLSILVWYQVVCQWLARVLSD